MFQVETLTTNRKEENTIGSFPVVSTHQILYFQEDYYFSSINKFKVAS